MKRLFLFFGLLSTIFFSTQAQVNVTQYADESLFEIKPVFNQDNVEEGTPQYQTQIEAEITHGFELMGEGKVDEALDIFINLSSEYPDEAYFEFCKGMVYYTIDQSELARESLEKSLRLDPTLFVANYYLALVFNEEGEFKSAKNELNKIAELEDYAGLANYGLALVDINQGFPYRALSHLKKSVKVDPEFSDSYFPLGMIEFYRGSEKNAKKYLDKAVELVPDWEEAIIFRGLVSIVADGNTDQFQKDITLLTSIDPTNYHYHSINGYLEMELGNYDKAVENFKKSLNLSVDTTHTGKHKFSSKMENDKNLNFAINQYSDERFKFYDEELKKVNRGICYIIEKEYIMAQKMFDSVLVDNEYQVLYFLKAHAYNKQYKNDLAIKYYSKALALDSTIFNAYEQRADCYLKNKDLASAYQDYESMIALNPKSKLGYKGRGSILIQSGYYVQAYRDYTKCIVLDRTDSDAFFDRAMAATYLNNFEEVNANLMMVVNLEPDDDESYLLLAENYLAMKDSLSAISMLDSAIKYERYKSYLYELKGKIQMSLGEYENAIETYSKAINYTYPREHKFHRAKCYYMVGKMDFAEKELKNFLKYENDHPEGNYLMGKIYLDMGKASKGEKLKQRGIDLGYQP